MTAIEATMSLSYRDPRVAAAQVTSKKTAVNPLVRFLPGGAIELATARRGRALRHHIDDTGHVQLLDTGDRSGRWVLGCRVILLGFAVLAVAWFSGAVLGLEEDLRGVALVVSAMLLWWTGAAILSSGYSRIERSFNADEGWFELKALVRLPKGKPPVTWLTLPQLRAVDELASARNNVAVLRLDAERAVEVVTEHRGLLERHVVAASGEVTPLDTARVVSHVRFSTDKRRALQRYGGDRADWAVVNLNVPD
jgi:hypothetical protein